MLVRYHGAGDDSEVKVAVKPLDLVLSYGCNVCVTHNSKSKLIEHLMTIITIMIYDNYSNHLRTCQQDDEDRRD